MINCICNRITDPSGVWSYTELIGAKAHIKSLSVSNGFFGVNCNKKFTIKDIYFRITLDGKTITLVEFDEMPEKVFTLKDIMVDELNIVLRVTAVCGFICGGAVCGYDVDLLPTFEKKKSNSGLAIEDENGNVVTNRKIRILGADVERVDLDDDDVTDISININGGTF